MTLNLAVSQISNRGRECYVHESLYDVATLAGSACNCTITVDLRLLSEGIFQALLKVPPQSLVMASVRSVNKMCVKVFDSCMMDQKPTLTGRRPASRVDCYDKIPLVCKTWSGSTSWATYHPTLPPEKAFFRRTSHRTREGRRTSEGEEESQPHLVVAFLPPVRLDDRPVHLLPFGTFEAKVLRRLQRFPDQGALGEGGDLFRRAIALEVVLGFGQVGFEVVQITEKEHVVRPLEQKRENISLPLGQDSEGADGAAVSRRLGGKILGWKRWEVRASEVAKDRSVRVLSFGDYLSDVMRASRMGVCRKKENEWKESPEERE